jgi:ABC-2 type transport system permease protein
MSTVGTDSSAAAPAPGGTAAWRHFVYVTRTLSSSEFKLRYFGSLLGYLWTFVRPLLLFGVLYVVFTKVIRLGGEVPHYPVVLLLGMVLFGFLGDSTGMALGSLVSRENLLRKVAFPRAAIPIAVSMTAAANLVLGLAVVLVLAVVNGVVVAWTWLYLIPIVLGLMVLAIAVSLILSILFVRYRDLQPMWEVALQLLFWGSPVIYTIDFVPERFREYVLYNPFAAAVQEARHQVVQVGQPSVAEVMGSVWKVAIPAGIVLVLLAIGIVLFLRLAPRVAEDL